jgi:hypothetical protein
MGISFGLLLFTMFYAPHKPLVFTAPHSPAPAPKVAQTAPKQPTVVVYRLGVDPHGTDELQPSDTYPAVPYGPPMITICYKDELGDWVVGTTTLYSGNADTKFEDSTDRYEYTGSCPHEN